MTGESCPAGRWASLCLRGVTRLGRVADATLRATPPLSYRSNGMSIFVLLLYSGYALGKVATRFRSSTIPQ